MELDGAGPVMTRYTYYPGIDQVHSMQRGNQTYYFATDHQGSVMAVFNAAKQVVNQYRYGPFGSIEHMTEQVQNPLRYTAREYEDASGLYHYRARWYDPDLHRFVSEDPIGMEGGINLYAYTGNDPINYKDPLGLYAALQCTWVATGGTDGKGAYICDAISGGGRMDISLHSLMARWFGLADRATRIPIPISGIVLHFPGDGPSSGPGSNGVRQAIAEFGQCWVSAWPAGVEAAAGLGGLMLHGVKVIGKEIHRNAGEEVREAFRRAEEATRRPGSRVDMRPLTSPAFSASARLTIGGVLVAGAKTTAAIAGSLALGYGIGAAAVCADDPNAYR
jgi:RHS repeat-associated protein